jgi:hypothetical protein
MIYLLLPIGLALPTVCGWLLLRIVEGQTPVLFKWERWTAGFVLGGILTTYLIFLTEVTGIGSFSFLSMFLTQLILLMILGGLYWKNRSKLTDNLNLTTDNSSPWKFWQKIVAATLGLWVIAKLVSGFILLIGPAYFDDTISNWNIRGKAFYIHQELILEIIPGKGSGIGSYPQAIPLQKAWLAHLGGWHEGLVNSLHMIWYLAALALVFFALRRLMNLRWSLLGVYLLASVPLYTMHGVSAYGDCFLSVVIFLAVSWLFFAARSVGTDRMTFIRLGAIATGLLIYTKSEALLLHLPPLAVLVLGLLILGGMTGMQKKKTIAWYGLCVSSVLIPWVLFKRMNDLGFGNAKNISGMALEWHEGVLRAIGINTFWEGNWSLLPILFLGLVIAKWRTAFRSNLIILTGFVIVVIVGQLPIYMFTALYVEALNQTGYARGIIHLIPVVVVVTTVILERVMSDE